MDKKEGDRKIAVYDLGGGTFDISIIEIAEIDGEHQFECCHQRRHLPGGEDFDQRIIDYIVDEFKKEQGVDLKNDVLALQRLERKPPKRPRSSCPPASQTEINLPYITADASGSKHLVMKITRANPSAGRRPDQRTIEPRRTGPQRTPASLGRHRRRDPGRRP